MRRGYPLPSRLGGLGERRKLPHRGPGRSSGRRRIWCVSALKSWAVLAIRPGRPWPTQTRSWPTQTARVIPMIPIYTTPVGLPKICLAFDWPTQMKIPRTAPV